MLLSSVLLINNQLLDCKEDVSACSHSIHWYFFIKHVLLL